MATFLRMTFPVRMVAGGAGQASLSVCSLGSAVSWESALTCALGLAGERGTLHPFAWWAADSLFSGGEIKGHVDLNRQSMTA